MVPINIYEYVNNKIKNIKIPCIAWVISQFIYMGKMYLTVDYFPKVNY